MTHAVTLLLLAALLFSAADARAQAPTKRVGFVTGVTPAPFVEAFRDGLRQHGWVEGKNLVLDFRSADGRFDRVPALTKAVVDLKPNVVVLTSTAVERARTMLGNVPGVFVISEDPVSAGLVQSFARPGGNLTGVTSLNFELDAKRLEIVKQTVPRVTRVGVMATPDDTSYRERVETIERTAKGLGLQVEIFDIKRADDVPRAMESATRAQVGAIMLAGSAALLQYHTRIADLAAKARLPLLSAWSETAEAGGLMSYGTNVPSMFRRAAWFVDRILKGTNPSDIPVERMATFELVINRKTAQALKIDIPAPVALRADRVID